jgi:hypothetical protein
MDAEELTEMLEGDAEEVDFYSQRSNGNYGMARPEEGDFYGARDSFELVDEVEIVPTQAGNADSRSKVRYTRWDIRGFCLTFRRRSGPYSKIKNVIPQQWSEHSFINICSILFFVDLYMLSRARNHLYQSREYESFKT